MRIAKLLNLVSIFTLTLSLVPFLVHRSQDIRLYSARIQPVGQSSGWNMVFDDEFDGSSLDLSKWTPDWLGSSDTAITKPVNSSETECVVPGASKVANGELDITATAQSCTINSTTYPYQSGLIESNGKFNFTYGYMEARIWQPAGTGMWPGFWSDGQNWPQDGEIDVLEGDGIGNSSYHYHYADAGWGLVAVLALLPYLVLSGWLLWCFYRREMRRSIVLCILLCIMLSLIPVVIYNYAGCGVSCGPGGSVVVPGATTNWHTYAADWEPGVITWYYDGHQVWQWTTSVTSSPMYLIVNLGLSSKQSAVPATMKVDYVRVWQKCITNCTKGSSTPK